MRQNGRATNYETTTCSLFYDQRTSALRMHQQSGSQDALSAPAVIPSKCDHQKTFIKGRPLARAKRFALMLEERFCDDE
jgi:hypothetical protein